MTAKLFPGGLTRQRPSIGAGTLIADN